MPTRTYYELLEELTVHQKKQALWRWQIFQAAEMLRSTLSSFLGVDYLTYNEGHYRYVELLTPALTPFHLTADGVIEYIQRIPTVNIVIVVALELDSGMTLCLCPIQIRLAHKKIEYRITKEGGRWISDPQIMLKWVYQTLKRNIAKLPTSNSTPSYFLHKNAQESLELLINTPQKANHMNIESTLQLLRRANEYEAYITSKLTMKNEHSSEELFQLRCRAKRKFPELREKPLTKSVELALFNDVLHRLALKLGFYEERSGLDIRYFLKN